MQMACNTKLGTTFPEIESDTYAALYILHHKAEKRVGRRLGTESEEAKNDMQTKKLVQGSLLG